MPNLYTPSTFLRAFNNVYKTLDVRVASVRRNEQWLLVASSAHFRIMSSDTAKQDFRDIVRRFGKVDSPVFRIVQQCLPIAETERFFDNLSKGELVLEDLRIRLSEPHDVLSHAGHSRIDHQNLERWPSIELQREINKDPNVTLLLLNDSEVLRAAELAGYEYSYVAVKTLLDIDYSQSTEAGRIWVECDIPARLLTPEVSRLGDELELTLRAESDPAIHDISCTIRRTKGGGPILQQSVIQLKRANEESKKPVSWLGKIQMLIEQEDQITLEILSREVGRLYSIRVKPFDLLSPEQANPLLAALEIFCSAEQIRLLLEEPQKAQFDLPNKKNPARLFEVSVQWLLSTLGCRAIWLHAYERIKNAKVELGTIDCLAYSEEENMLLLVNCSLGAPDPSELHRQENLTTWLRNQLFADSRVTVCSALFTASHRPETEAYGSAVRVFFKEDVDGLLEAARGGRKLEYSVFLNPSAPWHQWTY